MRNTIKVERAKKGITQTDLADKVGVTRLTIHSIEAGKFKPSVMLAMKIAAFFDTSVESIFELEEND